MHEGVISEILGSFVASDKYGTLTLSHYSFRVCLGALETFQSNMFWQEYLTSDTMAHSIFFVHPPSALLELATVSIFFLVLFGDKSKLMVDNRRVYAVDYAFSHPTDCHSEHDESLVGHLLTLSPHIDRSAHVWNDFTSGQQQYRV